MLYNALIRLGYNREITDFMDFTLRDTPGHPWHTALGHTGPAQAQPSPDGQGGRLDTPIGAFKFWPKAGHRRLQVQDPGDRGLGGAVGPLQSAI